MKIMVPESFPSHNVPSDQVCKCLHNEMGLFVLVLKCNSVFKIVLWDMMCELLSAVTCQLINFSQFFNGSYGKEDFQFMQSHVIC